MKVTVLDWRISALVPREQQPTLWSHPLPTSTCGSPWCLCPTNWKKIIIPSSWGKLASFPGSCPGHLRAQTIWYHSTPILNRSLEWIRIRPHTRAWERGYSLLRWSLYLHVYTLLLRIWMMCLCVQIELEVHKCLLDREMADLTHPAVLGRCEHPDGDKWSNDLTRTSTYTQYYIWGCNEGIQGSVALIPLHVGPNESLCYRLAKYIVKLRVSGSLAPPLHWCIRANRYWVQHATHCKESVFIACHILP